MIKIAHVDEAEQLRGDFPAEVAKVFTDVVSVLDSLYGKDRDIDGGLGGYVLVLEGKEELKLLADQFIDIGTVIPEYTDKIPVRSREPFTNTLILLNNDFSVSLITPLSITPKRFISEYPGEGWD